MARVEGRTRLREHAEPSGVRDEEAPPARVYLTPIAPPVTLGLFGFFASTMIVST